VSDIVYHDAYREGHYHTRTYRCTICDKLHQFKRPFVQIPHGESPCCQGPMSRAHDVDGMAGFVVKTEIRDVRHKLRREEREGKRPRAIEATV